MLHLVVSQNVGPHCEVGEVKVFQCSHLMTLLTNKDRKKKKKGLPVGQE